ncbi:MAG TPA: hypothetical protein VI431_15415 [Candidatus Acidoferrum sp.]
MFWPSPKRCLFKGLGRPQAIYEISSSLQNLDNLVYNYRAAMQNAINTCLNLTKNSPEACQKAIDLAALTDCIRSRAMKHSILAGLALPGTVVGGDFPSSKWDLAVGAIQDQITAEAEREVEKAEKNSEKKGCGCQQ